MFPFLPLSLSCVFCSGGSTTESAPILDIPPPPGQNAGGLTLLCRWELVWSDWAALRSAEITGFRFGVFNPAGPVVPWRKQIETGVHRAIHPLLSPVRWGQPIFLGRSAASLYPAVSSLRSNRRAQRCTSSALPLQGVQE